MLVRALRSRCHDDCTWCARDFFRWLKEWTAAKGKRRGVLFYDHAWSSIKPEDAV